MLHLKKILAPRDFSSCSDYAFKAAVELAQRTGADLHVLYADVLHSDISTVAGSGEKAVQQLQARLLDGTEKLSSGSDTRVEAHVERDYAAALAIVSFARREDIDMIVMGTHGRRGLERRLLGSTAEEVSRTSPCPALTVRPPNGDAAEKLEIRKILVPIDFSKDSEVALHHARLFAELYGASLDLLHIVEERMHPAFYNTGAFSIRDLMPDVEQRAIEELKAYFKQSDGPVCGVSYHTGFGNVAHEIADFASSHGSDLIVMATHGLTGLKHMVLGSVTEKVIRWSKAPVLSVTTRGKTLVSRQPLLNHETA